MPRSDAYRMSRSKSQVVATPYTYDDGTLMPCRKCGRNDGELVGNMVTALYMEHERELVGKKRVWAVQHAPGPDEDSDNVARVTEKILKVENYHRECENSYQRKRRASKHTRDAVAIARLERQVNELIQIVTQLHTQTPAPPPPQPAPQPSTIVYHEQPRQPRRQRFTQYGLPTVDPSVSSRFQEPTRDIKDILADYERMEAREKLLRSSSVPEEDNR